MAATSLFNKINQTLAELGQPEYTGIVLHTASSSMPIPILWGTRRISPQIVWSAPFAQQKLTVQGVPGNECDGLFLPSGLPTGYQAHSSSLPSHWAFAGTAPTGGALVAIVGTYFGSIQVNAGLSQDSTSGHATSPFYGADGGSYFVPTILAFCESDAAGGQVLRVWNDGASAGISLSDQRAYNTANPNPCLFATQLHGFPTQTTWGYFTAAAAQTTGATVGKQGATLTLRYTLCLGLPLSIWSADGKPPQQSFEVVRNVGVTFGSSGGDSYGIGIDQNPATCLADLLTHPSYGLGLTTSDYDSTSWNVWFSYCYCQGILFSPLLKSQTTATDIINRWAKLSNTWIYWDGTIIRFVPLGDAALGPIGSLSYTPDTAPAYNLGLGDFGKEGLQVDRADPIDCFNRVRLEFPDRNPNGYDYSSDVIEWKEATLINQFGLRDASNISAEDICDVVVAAKSVSLIGKRMAYIRTTYTFTLSYRYILILPGTLVTLTDPNLGLNQVGARITSVAEDANGRLSVTAEEYPGVLGVPTPPVPQFSNQLSTIPFKGASFVTGTVSGVVGLTVNAFYIQTNSGPTTVTLPSSGGGLPDKFPVQFNDISGSANVDSVTIQNPGGLNIFNPQTGAYTTASSFTLSQSGFSYTWVWNASNASFDLVGNTSYSPSTTGTSMGGAGVVPISGPTTVGDPNVIYTFQAVAGGYTLTMGNITPGVIYRWVHVNGAAGTNMLETPGQAVTLSAGLNTFTIEDPQDRFAATANSVQFLVSQQQYEYYLDSKRNVFCCLRQVQ